MSTDVEVEIAIASGNEHEEDTTGDESEHNVHARWKNICGILAS